MPGEVKEGINIFYKYAMILELLSTIRDNPIFEKATNYFSIYLLSFTGVYTIFKTIFCWLEHNETL